MIYLGNGLYSDSCPDTLAHYGVLGMKWGVRKSEKHLNNMSRLKYDARREGAKYAYQLNKERNPSSKSTYKDQYKKHKRAIKDKYIQDRLKNKESSKKLVDAYKKDKKKFKNKYKTKSDIVDNTINSIDKKNPGYKKYVAMKKEVDKDFRKRAAISAAMAIPMMAAQATGIAPIGYYQIPRKARINQYGVIPSLGSEWRASKNAKHIKKKN